ncbi:MAG: hypothetical protein JW719_04230 [Pirellulales bacterium]|nr:hypothetical protein [Pirellulales bacterium]
MSEAIQEFVDSRGVTMRVDRREGILRGVKVLGLRSRNGRTYLPEALAAAAGLYEGAKVNVNHPKTSPTAARDYQDRIGNLRNVLVRVDEGLFADFHFNPKHSLAEQLLWDAEHAPENVGFSHNVLARTACRDGRTVVEAITKVQSVDLVADPATTQGLFESVESVVDDGGDASCDTLSNATLSNAVTESPSMPDDAILGESNNGLVQAREELARAESELERLRASESQARRQVLIYRLLDEAGLSGAGGVRAGHGAIVTERFLEMLAQAPDEKAVRELIGDRAALVESLLRGVGKPGGEPRSRDQSRLAETRLGDARSFVRAIT